MKNLLLFFKNRVGLVNSLIKATNQLTLFNDKRYWDVKERDEIERLTALNKGLNEIIKNKMYEGYDPFAEERKRLNEEISSNKKDIDRYSRRYDEARDEVVHEHSFDFQYDNYVNGRFCDDKYLWVIKKEIAMNEALEYKDKYYKLLAAIKINEDGKEKS